MSWLKRIFHRRRLYDDLGEEVRAHIEEKTEQLMRLENLSREEAEQAARRAFGNLTLIEERSREVWQWAALESILADLKLALRRLRKSPGFAATVLSDAGDRHRRQYRGVQRAEQRAAEAAALSRAGATGGPVAARAGRGRAGRLSRRAAPVAVDVPHLRRAQPDLSVDGRVDVGHSQRDWPCAAGGGARNVHQRWCAADARCSAGCRAMDSDGRPGSAQRTRR